MVQPGIISRVCDKKDITSRLHHSHCRSGIILGSLSPGFLGLAIFDQDWSKIIGVFYSFAKKVIA